MGTDTGSHSHLTCAGQKILNNFDGSDATDAFYSLHSESAIKQLKLMK